MGSLTPDDRAPAPEAAARVEAYLRCLGLTDAPAKAFAARWVAAGDGLPRLQAEVSAWCEASAPADPPGGPAAGAILLWLLRPVLAERPDLFLRREAWPGPARDALRAASVPCLPAESPAPMPTQVFGDMPAVLRREFWRGVGRVFRLLRSRHARRPEKE
jgi:hypothetical protein